MSSCVNAPLTEMDLVRGRSGMAADLKLPGMLHGRMLLSPVSHGEISGLDLQKALTLPGVKAVISADDCPDCYQGHLAKDIVEYAGQPVAALAASSPELADKALAAISVQYEEMPAVLSWDEALADGEHLVWHQETKGDPAAAFGQAALVLEDTFELPGLNPLPPEPWTCVAQPAGEGLTLWTNIYYDPDDDSAALELAASLGLDEDLVRVVSLAQPNGPLCAFDLQAWELCAAALALKSGRPVRMQLSRAEEAALAPRSAAMRVHSKLGFDAKGRIIAQEQTWDLQCGMDLVGRDDAAWMSVAADLSYGAENYAHTVRCAGGNLPPYNVLPGLGSLAPQWALESQLNQAALELGLDPVQIRLANLQKPGTSWEIGPFKTDDETLSGDGDGDDYIEEVALPENGFKACLEYAAEKGWSKDDSRGLACFAAWGGGDEDFSLFCGVLSLKAEMDQETGQVRVRELELVHSAGADEDLAPALIMGLGIAQSEGLQLENGRVLNNGPASYRPPRVADLPAISQTGLGAVAEYPPWAAGMAVVPALARTISRMCGYNPTRTPFDPETILRGMGKILV